MLDLGGVFGPSPSEVLSMGSCSGLTTTMGGAGDALSGGAYPRCAAALPIDEFEFGLPDDREPLDPGKEWLLLLARLLRLATAEPGCGSGLLAFGGGGGGAAAAAAAADVFDSFVFEDEDSVDLVLLSCGRCQSAFLYIEHIN